MYVSPTWASSGVMNLYLKKPKWVNRTYIVEFLIQKDQRALSAQIERISTILGRAYIICVNLHTIIMPS